jgi:hypothetical protein
LRRAYPNYFLDTTAFIDLVNERIGNTPGMQDIALSQQDYFLDVGFVAAAGCRCGSDRICPCAAASKLPLLPFPDQR